jgi:uroporphyrinogen decarboxylase
VDRQRLDIEGTRKALELGRAEGRWTFFGHLFIWERLRNSLGDISMFENLLLEPEWIHDFNRVYTDFYKAHYSILFKEAGLPDGIWIYEDLGYRNGLFCSTSTLSELIFPYYSELVAFFHSYGLPVVLHSCGGIAKALPLIVEAGFDGLNPMQVSAGCDVVKFAEEYGDRLMFFGGMDTRVLESGNQEIIRSETLRILQGMKRFGGRYAFGSDHSLSTNIKYLDFLYVAEVFRENCTL